MDRPSCSQLRTQLQEVKSLKAEFDFKVDNIKIARNTAPALKLEEEIREGIRFIRESLMLARCEWAEVTIGTKSKEELIKELEDREKSNNPEDKIYIYDYDEMENIFQNPDFKIINKPEKITLIRLKVKDLGLKQGNTTTDQLYQRAKELGLELCPPEIGPYLRLNYQEVFRREQPKDEYFYIGMKPITNSGGRLSIFSVGCNDDGDRWLDYFRAQPGSEWNLENEFIFSRK